jgi:adenylate cyclase
VAFTDPAEFAFRHPLTRAVAYESQLKAERAQLHRRLAGAIEARGAADENAALIAQHIEAAGDLRAAFDWHMRAATWSTFRNFAGAQSSWLRARDVADQLPGDGPEKLSMRIAPRTLLCAHEYRIRSGRADGDFAELKELCAVAGDKRSLAIGLAGMALAAQLDARSDDASQLATELVGLLESLDDSALTVGLSVAYLNIGLGAARIRETLQLAQRVIDLSEGKPGEAPLISVSPFANAVAIRGVARWCLGQPGWREDFVRASETITAVSPALRSGTFWIVYLMAFPNGVLLPTDEALTAASEIDSAAEQFGEQVTVDLAKIGHGVTLAYREGPQRDAGASLLEGLYADTFRRRYTIPGNLPLLIFHVARERGRLGDDGDAIELARGAVDAYRRSGERIWLGSATAALVELLLHRGSNADLRDARDAVATLAATLADPGVILYEIWLLRLRALLAHAEGDDAAYRDYRDRYRKMANDLGFEGHMQWAAEMV